MISVSGRGDFRKTREFLNRCIDGDIYADLHLYGRMGVEALSQATPKDTGKSSQSWGYRLIRKRSNPGIEWYNSDTTPQGTPIVILIQYGHATGNGGYVHGVDFINPTMRFLFEQIADDVWKKVKQ